MIVLNEKSMILPHHPDRQAESKGLWAIGYWRATFEQAQATREMNSFLSWLGKVVSSVTVQLPDPRDFVDPAWDPTERDRVIFYLRSGKRLTSYFGYSTCRFKCGIDDRDMGDADLTDGTYVWPEGFAHYLDRHHVRPPEVFVQHVHHQWDLALRGGR